MFKQVAWDYSKSIIFVFAGLFIFPMTTMAEDLQQPQAVLESLQRAGQCIADKDYVGARTQYQQILADYPNSIESQTGLIQVCIWMDDLVAAESETTKLLSHFSAHADIAKAVSDVAGVYFRTGRYRQAEQLCGVIEDQWPSADEAVWGQKMIACCRIRQDDLEGAQTAYDLLLADFGSHPKIAKAVYDIGNQYYRDGHYAEANQVLATVMDRWPDSKQVTSCRQTLAKSMLQQGDWNGAKSATDQLIADYSDRPEIAATVRFLADRFRRSQHHTEAIDLYQTVCTHWPESDVAMWCHQGLACSRIKQRDLVGAAVATESLISEYAAHPDIALGLRDVANEYLRAGYYADASRLCRWVVDRCPDSNAVFWCRQALAKALLGQEDWEAAKAEADGLILDYQDIPETAATIRFLADRYRRSGHHIEAIDLYQAVRNHWPDSDAALWSQQGLTCSLIKQQDLERAAAEAESLILNYAAHPKVATALRDVANEYFRAGLHKEAGGLCQTLLTRWPNSDPAMWAKQTLMRMQIREGDLEGSDLARAELIAEETDHPRLDNAIIAAAEDHYTRALTAKQQGLHEQARQNFLKSITIITQDLFGRSNTDPNNGLEINTTAAGHADLSHELESMGWYVVGLNNWQLGRWFQAADAFMQSIDADPQHPFAGTMYWMVSDCYERLKQAGTVNAEEADMVIEWGYQSLFDGYPDSRDVTYAALQLGKINLARGEPEAATFYFNWFLEHAPVNHPQVAQVKRMLTQIEGAIQ